MARLKQSDWKFLAPGLALLGACTTAPVQDKQPVTASAPSESKAVALFNSCAKPVYPREDHEARHEGTVTLSFLVGADGRTREAKIIKSSGYPGLDESARNGIAKCDFKPATKDGQPVESWVPIQYVWTLG